MVNLVQCDFGDSLSGYALPVQDLVKTLLKLTHGVATSHIYAKVRQNLSEKYSEI